MIRLAVRAPAEQAEEALAALLELAPSGLEQADGDGWVEYAVYAPAAELRALPDGEAELGGVAVRVRREQVPEDWAERWKRFHRPQLIGGLLYVRPPWEEPAVRPGLVEIVIDPGQAFGTGAYPTTRLCLELMLELESRSSFVDLGCGSGMLAIAAAKLGHGPVSAFDADRAAIEATDSNARANGVALDRLERFDLRDASPPRADVVAANLMRPLLLRVAELMAEWRPRALIASGLLDDEVDEVATAFTPLERRARRSEAGWSAVLLERPA